MNKREKVINILNNFTRECVIIFGEKLNDVRLYGSYARGDFDNESDVDVMLILDMDEIETMKWYKDVCTVSSMLGREHKIFLSPILQGKTEYDLRKNTTGIWYAAEHEGVSLYAG